MEKILRVQPNVKKLYLLLRAADHKSAIHRLHNEVWLLSLLPMMIDFSFLTFPNFLFPSFFSALFDAEKLFPSFKLISSFFFSVKFVVTQAESLPFAYVFESFLSFPFSSKTSVKT